MNDTVTRSIRLWIASLLAALAFGCAGSAPAGPSASVTATYSITGTVTDRAASASLVGAEVTVMDGPFAGTSVVTDDQGIYRLLVLSGSLRLHMTKTGYVDITIPVGPLTRNVTVDAQLTRQSSGVSGRVTESPPTDATPVPFAQLRVVNGPAAGAVATADRDGAFWLTELTAAADVTVQATGYSDTTVHLDPATDQVGRVIRLPPTPRTITETIGASDAPRQPAASFFRDVHNAGSIVVSQLYFDYAYEESNPPTRTVEIWDGTRLVAAATINQPQFFNVALEAHVDGGRRYLIRITGGEWSAVTIASPN